ncbi:hypothetical protein ACLOJK_029169 [Asimina triloba]
MYSVFNTPPEHGAPVWCSIFSNPAHLHLLRKGQPPPIWIRPRSSEPAFIYPCQRRPRSNTPSGWQPPSSPFSSSINGRSGHGSPLLSSSPTGREAIRLQHQASGHDPCVAPFHRADHLHLNPTMANIRFLQQCIPSHARSSLFKH